MTQRKLTTEEIGRACLSLAHLYHAGIGTGDALALLAEDQSSPADARFWSDLARQADNGAGLAQIFRESGYFPDYVCALLHVGEEVGRSEEALYALARYYESRAEMNRQLRAALLYPAILLCVLLVVAAVLLIWVLPVFDEVYAQLGGSLTGIAGAALALGACLKRCLPLLCVLLAAAAALVCLFALSQRARDAFTSVARRFRTDRGLTRERNTARFAQALSMGLCSGLTDRDAVELAVGLSGDCDGFRRRCSACLAALDEGASLSAALRENELLSRADCRLLEAGMRSGSGEIIMDEISRRLLKESESAIDELAGRIEPTLVVVLSVLVGGILLSVMLPLMHIMTTIG